MTWANIWQKRIAKVRNNNYFNHCLLNGFFIFDSLFELFFCKKIPLSRRVEYVLDGSIVVLCKKGKLTTCIKCEKVS